MGMLSDSLCTRVVVWESGNDTTESNQDPIEHIIVGLLSVLHNLLKFVIWLIEVVLKGAIIVLRTVLRAITRFGRWGRRKCECGDRT